MRPSRATQLLERNNGRLLGGAFEGRPSNSRRDKACIQCSRTRTRRLRREAFTSYLRCRRGRGALACRADLNQALYTVTQGLNDVVIGSLESKTVQWYVYPLTTVAGLATSLSPCVLSILPITIGYIGGYTKTETATGGEGNNPAGGGGAVPQLGTNAVGFALGLASSFAVLGIFSTTLGKTYGQTGPALPCIASVVAVTMGLNLLEVIQVQFPSAFQNFDPRNLGIPPILKSYLAGLAFAFVSSPCSTPVLATLLAYVSTLDNPSMGGLLLLFYATGYVTPLLVAASATETLKGIPAFRAYSQWINPVSGMLLVGGGTYFFLDSFAALV